MRHTRLIAILMTAAVTLGACAGASAEPAAEQPAAGQTASASIEIRDFGFGEAITVSAGEVVTVANNDGAPHTVTADGGAFDTGSIAAGSAVTFTAPTEPGTYTFFCSIHPSMQGVVTVQG